jgi:enoyl-CoA hydratase
MTVKTTTPAPGVRLLTLDRPDRLNAMNAQLVTGLDAALQAVAADRECRVAILTGAGRAFCGGLDLGGYGDAPGFGPEDGAVVRKFARQQHIASLILRLRSLPQPVIAAVNGPASGGGFALVLGSDLRIASRSARFNAAFIKIGLSACDIGTSWLLPRLVGAARAQELMLTGRLFDSEEALRIGLVTDVVDDDRLLDRALEQAAVISGNSPFGVSMTKQVMWSALEVPGLQAALELENRTQIMASFTEDHPEAIAAFVEKRKPQFRGR